MNKFRKLLQSSNKEIKAARAKILDEETSDAMSDLLRRKRQAKRDIEKKLLSLGDLHQDSELSLRVVKPDFNAKQWLEELHNTKLELLEATIELKSAEELNDEWFGEAEEEPATSIVLTKDEGKKD